MDELGDNFSFSLCAMDESYKFSRRETILSRHRGESALMARLAVLSPGVFILEW